MYRVNQAQYVIHILVAASQEYVNTYSTRRVRVRVNPKPESASEPSEFYVPSVQTCSKRKVGVRVNCRQIRVGVRVNC